MTEVTKGGRLSFSLSRARALLSSTLSRTLSRTARAEACIVGVVSRANENGRVFVFFLLVLDSLFCDSTSFFFFFVFCFLCLTFFFSFAALSLTSETPGELQRKREKQLTLIIITTMAAAVTAPLLSALAGRASSSSASAAALLWRQSAGPCVRCALLRSSRFSTRSREEEY